MVEPRVSILIPAYNAENTVAETLESALSQTWRNKEVILVDDGSCDRTRAIAESYIPRGIRVTSQLNSGASAARNHALSLCSGDYVQWLDADDLLGKEKIERQMNAALSLNKADRQWTLLSGPWAHFYYSTSRAKFSPTALWEDLSPVEWLTRKMRDGSYMQTGTWLVSRALSDAAGPWNTSLLGDDDGEYFCRVKLHAKRIKFVPNAAVYYRRVPGTRLSDVGVSDRKIEAHWRSMRMHIDYLLAMEDSERTRLACVNYLRKYVPYFMPGRRDVIHEMQQLASKLGAALGKPTLGWKYDWLTRVIGWERTTKLKRFYNYNKTRFISALDYAALQQERRTCCIENENTL